MLRRDGLLDISSLAKEGYLRASPRAHGGPYYVKTRREDIIDFSTSVNPLGPSPHVISTVRKNLKLVAKYPDPDAREVKEKVADYTGLESENIVVGNGANDLIHQIADVFIRSNERVVIPIPTFFEYEFACDRNSADIHFSELNDLALSKESIINDIDQHTKMLFLCNPNNPTGRLAEKNDLKEILDQAYNKGTMVILDECFIEFVEHPEKMTFAAHMGEYENLIILRTFTKAFGLAGLRIGYCLANEKIAKVMNRTKVPWSVNALAQKAAVEALNHTEHLEKTRILVKKEKKYLYDNLTKLDGYRVFGSDTNFFLVRPLEMESTALHEKLLNKRILVRDCSTFTGMGTEFVRVSVQKRKENTTLLKALKAI